MLVTVFHGASYISTERIRLEFTVNGPELPFYWFTIIVSSGDCWQVNFSFCGKAMIRIFEKDWKVSL